MKTVVWFVLPLLVVVMLCVANIVASAKAVNMGGRMKELNDRQTALRKEQKELDAQLASALSLHNLRDEALAMGYVPATTALYVTSETPVAMR